MLEKAEKLETGFLFGFETQVSVAGITDVTVPARKRGAGKEVERILSEANKPLHLRLIIAELSSAGFTNTYQTMSGVLQILCKKKKVFKKVAPATYALIGYKKAVRARTVRKSKPVDPFSEKAVSIDNDREA